MYWVLLSSLVTIDLAAVFELLVQSCIRLRSSLPIEIGTKGGLSHTSSCSSHHHRKTMAWIRAASVSVNPCYAAAAFAASLSCLTRGISRDESSVVASCQSDESSSSRTETTSAVTAPTSKLIFLGSGSSTGCPRPLCTMLFGSHPPTAGVEMSSTWLQEQLRYCHVSNLAIQGNPKDNRDYRNNPSLLVSYCQENNDDDDNSNDQHQTCQNVVIDVGKTFREGALRWFPEYGISSLDAIVLTHHHMDAVGGLDDVRGFQRVGFPEPKKSSSLSTTTTATTETTKLSSSSALPVHLQPTQLPPPSRVSIPVFLSQECLDQVSTQFPWLFPKQQQQQQRSSSPSSESRPVVQRDVAALDVHIIDDRTIQPFEVVKGLTMTPLPVWHGDDLISLGFAFSIPKQATTTNSQTTTNIVYISDISRMIPETLDYIMTQLPQPTHILVVDALLTGDRTHPVHFNLEQAVALTETIQPQQAYLVGMSCDSFLPHDEMNQHLRAKYGNVQLAHDGLVIDL